MANANYKCTGCDYKGVHKDIGTCLCPKCGDLMGVVREVIEVQAITVTFSCDNEGGYEVHDSSGEFDTFYSDDFKVAEDEAKSWVAHHESEGATVNFEELH